MAESKVNETKNVSASRGVAGGYCFSAPVGTTLPTDVSSKLDEAFACMGFISEDGVTFTTDEDSDDLNDMNGDVMDSTYSGHADSCQLTFAEMKVATLKRMYGDDNVTDTGGMISVKHNSNSHPEFAYVFELLLKNGRKWRIVVPDGKSDALDDLTVAASELAGRPLTIKFLQDAAGNTYYEYIESTESTKA